MVDRPEDPRTPGASSDSSVAVVVGGGAGGLLAVGLLVAAALRWRRRPRATPHLGRKERSSFTKMAAQAHHTDMQVALSVHDPDGLAAPPPPQDLDDAVRMAGDTAQLGSRA